MKTLKIWWLLAAIFLTASTTVAQQQFTHTVTAANRSCNSTCSVLDIPELNNNLSAIILVTPILVNDTNRNPHPIGAYFMYMKKWSILNLDQTSIVVGAQFNVQYFANPGPDRFVFTVPRQVHLSDIPYIDHIGLNGNPNANVRFFPNWISANGGLFNVDEVKGVYDSTAGKWYVANVNGKPVPWSSAYNVVFSAGGAVATTPRGSEGPIKDGRLRDPAGTVPPSKPAAPDTSEPTLPPGINPPRSPRANPWALRKELAPSIPPNSDILLFIHGMDSRAEEADDITKALFMVRASGTAPQPAPVAAPTPNPLIPVLQQLVQKYKSCILEKYETQQDMINRGLNGGLSGLSNTNGLQVRDNITCVAGNTCSLAFRATQFTLLLAQANSGDATNFQSKLEHIVPKDCFMCQKHQEFHTKHVHCTMEAGGNSGFQGPGFEGCKAGVDIEKLANDIIADITVVINDIAGIHAAETQAIGGPSVATNFMTVHFNSCPNPAGGCPEGCDHPDNFSGGQRAAVVPSDMVDGQQTRVYFEPIIPPSLLDTAPPPNQTINVPAAHNIGRNEGRLRPDLRMVAAVGDPLKSLALASNAFAIGNTVEGNAFADLSVTGRKAFSAFVLANPQESFCQTVVAGRPSQLSESAVLGGCHTALDRAYRVANFLRTGERAETAAEKTAKATERAFLGWITVSGEDDQPHRPVNVPSSDFPQFNIDVVVETPMATGPQKTVTVSTRYTIAQSPANATNPKNLVVISLDLPSSGYTQNLDYRVISPLTDIGTPKWTILPIPIPVPVEITYLIPGLPPILPPGTVIPPGTPLPDFQSTGKTPLLDFIETFVVRFAETLDQKVPVKSQIKAVMGGSLGGNMTLRLGRRPGVPWMPNFIVWSPASIWNSLGEGNDILKHLGPRSAWESADKAINQPGDGDRAGFFGGWDKPIVWPIVREAQSGTWTSEFYACKLSSVAGARLDRHETYNALFLAWHWRLGGEQLLFSHQTTDPATNQPRYMANQKRMLLACGLEDQVPYNEICPATQKTAKLMTLTPGKALFLDKTGHSLDNERRTFWANQVLDFIK